MSSLAQQLVALRALRDSISPEEYERRRDAIHEQSLYSPSPVQRAAEFVGSPFEAGEPGAGGPGFLSRLGTGAKQVHQGLTAISRPYAQAAGLVPPIVGGLAERLPALSALESGTYPVSGPSQRRIEAQAGGAGVLGQAKGAGEGLWQGAVRMGGEMAGGAIQQAGELAPYALTSPHIKGVASTMSEALAEKVKQGILKLAPGAEDLMDMYELTKALGGSEPAAIMAQVGGNVLNPLPGEYLRAPRAAKNVALGFASVPATVGRGIAHGAKYRHLFSSLKRVGRGGKFTDPALFARWMSGLGDTAGEALANPKLAKYVDAHEMEMLRDNLDLAAPVPVQIGRKDIIPDVNVSRKASQKRAYNELPESDLANPEEIEWLKNGDVSTVAFKHPVETSTIDALRAQGIDVDVVTRGGTKTFGDPQVSVLFRPSIMEGMRKSINLIRGLGAKTPREVIERALAHGTDAIMPVLRTGSPPGGGIVPYVVQLKHGKDIVATRAAMPGEIAKRVGDLESLAEAARAGDPGALRKLGVKKLTGKLKVDFAETRIPKTRPDMRADDWFGLQDELVHHGVPAERAKEALAHLAAGNKKEALKIARKGVSEQPSWPMQPKFTKGEMRARRSAAKGVIDDALKAGAKPLPSRAPIFMAGAVAANKPNWVRLPGQVGILGAADIPGTHQLVNNYGGWNDPSLARGAMTYSLYHMANESVARGFVGKLGGLGSDTAKLIDRLDLRQMQFAEDLSKRWKRIQELVPDPVERQYLRYMREMRLEEVDPFFLQEVDRGAKPLVKMAVDELESITDDAFQHSRMAPDKHNPFYMRHIYDKAYIREKVAEKIGEIQKAKIGDSVVIPGKKDPVFIARDSVKRGEIQALQDRLNRVRDYDVTEPVSDWAKLNRHTDVKADFLERRSGIPEEWTKFVEPIDEVMPQLIHEVARYRYLDEVIPALEQLRNSIKGRGRGSKWMKEHLNRVMDLQLSPGRSAEDEFIRGLLSKPKLFFSPKMLTANPRIVDKAAASVRRIAFQMFLGFNPSTAAINMTQSPINVASSLGPEWFALGAPVGAGRKAKHSLSRMGLDTSMDEFEAMMVASGRSEKLGTHVKLDKTANEMLEGFMPKVGGAVKRGVRSSLDGLFDLGAVMYNMSEGQTVWWTGRASYLKAKYALKQYKGLAKQAEAAGMRGPRADIWVWQNLDKNRKMLSTTLKDNIIFHAEKNVERAGREATQLMSSNPQALRAPGKGKTRKLLSPGRQPTDEIVGHISLDPLASIREAVAEGIPGEMRWVQDRMTDGIDIIQFAYTHNNVPMIGQYSSIARAALQFNDFNRMQLEFVFNNLANNKAKMRFFSMMAALGGPYAVPFMADLSRNSDTIRGWLEQYKKSDWRFDASSRLGVNFANRLSIGAPLQGDPMAEGTAERIASVVPGAAPVINMGKLTGKLLDVYSDREPGRAGELQAAFRLHDPGAQLRSGRIPQDSISGKVLGAGAGLLNATGVDALAVTKHGDDIVGPGTAITEAMPIGSTALSNLIRAGQGQGRYTTDARGNPKSLLKPGLMGKIQEVAHAAGFSPGISQYEVREAREQMETAASETAGMARLAGLMYADKGPAVAKEFGVSHTALMNELQRQHSTQLGRIAGSVKRAEAAQILHTQPDFIDQVMTEARTQWAQGDKTGALVSIKNAQHMAEQDYMHVWENYWRDRAPDRSATQKTEDIKALVASIWQNGEMFNDPGWAAGMITKIISKNGIYDAAFGRWFGTVDMLKATAMVDALPANPGPEDMAMIEVWIHDRDSKLWTQNRVWMAILLEAAGKDPSLVIDGSVPASVRQ